MRVRSFAPCACLEIISIAGHSKGAISNAIKDGLVERIGVLVSVTDTVISSPISPKKPLVQSSVQTGPLRVAELRVYPIKSCGSGTALDKLVVDHLGPQHDRCFMVCQKPHWNRESWQDTWGAVTPRTPKENSSTGQIIDGPSLLLVDVVMNPDATMTISSKNAARPMPALHISVKPPADAPLIENVHNCAQLFFLKTVSSELLSVPR